MLLLIIVPFLNGYTWEYTIFSDKHNIDPVGKPQIPKCWINQWELTKTTKFSQF